jgi:integrase/recombinase XerD
MKEFFVSPLADDFKGFLQFKRSLGYKYVRAEFTLRQFDHFLQGYAAEHKNWQLDRAILKWLGRKPQRKAISVSMYTAVLRQFYVYLRRRPVRSNLREPLWPKLPTESTFTPYVLSKNDIQRLLQLAAQLNRQPFRAKLYRALLLILYCTGLRFGEALRLRMRDIDTSSGLLFVEQTKGRARWVPFHRSLAKELDKYLVARQIYAPSRPEDYFLVGANKRKLPITTASDNVRKLLRKAGLKPNQGRRGPRPYDLRHTFAVHRLTRWYEQGIDINARLPWLSAYMGHDDILGTETYLTATPRLLSFAANRFYRRYQDSISETESDSWLDKSRRSSSPWFKASLSTTLKD